MKVITISREFGSGGRELGKRLADELGFAYYDREIITAVAQKLSMDEQYLESVSERGIHKVVPLTFSRTLMQVPSLMLNDAYYMAQQHKLIKELAEKGDCVIVGRGADKVLAEGNPFSVFVYADMDSKVERCRSRQAEEEKLSDRELLRKMKQVDKARADNYALFSNSKWGDMKNYQLCINTTDTDIKAIVPVLASYARQFFEGKNL